MSQIGDYSKSLIVNAAPDLDPDIKANLFQAEWYYLLSSYYTPDRLTWVGQDRVRIEDTATPDCYELLSKLKS